MSNILYEKDSTGQYAIFKLNRPDRLNALNSRMMIEINNALADFDNDPQMRVGIVTGIGRAFSAGADMREAVERKEAFDKLILEGNLNGKEIEEVIDRDHPEKKIEFDLFSKSKKPFIAAINGLAVGGGMHWVMDCDVRITSENAYFSLPEPKIGMPANYGSQYLPDLIPLGESLYYLLTSDRMSAQNALRLGLVHEILSSDDLMPRAISIASMIIEGAPKAIEATKKMVYFSRSETRLAREEYAAPILEDVQKSSDIEEGRLAFIERRKPKWSG